MNEHAIVLKHLGLRVAEQGERLQRLSAQRAAFLDAAGRERVEGEQLIELLGLDPPCPMPRLAKDVLAAPGAPTRTDWSKVRDAAALSLRAVGVDPAGVRLPPSEHALDALDVAGALTFGALGALTPSLGSRRGLVGDAFTEIQRAADTERLPHVVQAVFGRHPAPFMDAGASGIYHRFCDGHDLVAALPAAASKLGWVRGPVQVFQHLLTDSFGATGIPLPGSSIVGSAVARVAGVANIGDLISPRDLSRYAALRMSDGVATGVTSLLLAIYANARGISEGSPRRAKLGVLAHGLCLVGVAACASVPGLMHLVPFRSHINYVSLVALAKNVWAWRGLAAKLAAQNDADFELIRARLTQLELRAEFAPDSLRTELAFAANAIARA